MAAASRITSKGQTTVPKYIRDALELSDGARVSWELVDGTAVLTPRMKTIDDIAGMLGDPLGRRVRDEEAKEALGQFLEDDDERIKREWNEGRDDRR